MLQSTVHIERRSSDKLTTIGRCLGFAFRPEATNMFDELIAALDAVDERRAATRLPPNTGSAVGTAVDNLAVLACGEITILHELVETGPTLISCDQMMQIMLDACPSFREHWDLFYKVDAADPTESNEGLPDRLPLYLAMHDLARHIACKLDCGETSQLPAVFEVVERWIVEGCETVRLVAISGFLEDLLLPQIYVVASPKDFLRWVGPRTYKWWVEASGFWDRLAAGTVNY